MSDVFSGLFEVSGRKLKKLKAPVQLQVSKNQLPSPKQNSAPFESEGLILFASFAFGTLKSERRLGIRLQILLNC